MPDDLRDVADRRVILVVFAGAAAIGLRQALVAAGIDEVPGLIDVAAFAGRPAELDQGQFDLLVAVRPRNRLP